MSMSFGPGLYEERRCWPCWANCPCYSFQDFQVPTYVVLIHQRYRQTDRRTDDMHAFGRNTALCTKVHRAVKKVKVAFVFQHFYRAMHYSAKRGMRSRVVRPSVRLSVCL